jgi:cytidine deaminase
VTTSSKADQDQAERRLAEAAWQMRAHAVCPYSGFAVGAAIESSDGRIFTGANVENASFNLGLCAERVALFHAMTHGGTGFVRVAVATDTPTPTSPCGACRQILYEFAPEAVILFVTGEGIVRRMTVTELVPDGFDARALAQTRG